MIQDMEEITTSILYGCLPIDIPPSLTLSQQLEIVRALAVNPSARSRLRLPTDIHPWVGMLLSRIK